MRIFSVLAAVFTALLLPLICLPAAAQTLPFQNDCVENGALLPPETCTIAPPQIATVLSLDTPWVSASFSAIDAYEAEGERGCFFVGPDAFIKMARRAEGWSEDRANAEYSRFIAANILAGTLTFYGEDPLKTPRSIQRIDGACADVANIAAIRQHQNDLIRLFDPIVREVNVQTPCAPAASPRLWPGETVKPEVSRVIEANPWTFLEITFIALGAGWFEGVSAHDPGRPLPPICHPE